MSRYEKVDFLMYELQNGFRMALKPFNPPPPPLPPLGGGGGGGGLVVGCYPSVLNPQSSVFCFLNPQSSILSFLFSLIRVCLNTLLMGNDLV